MWKKRGWLIAGHILFLSDLLSSTTAGLSGVKMWKINWSPYFANLHGVKVYSVSSVGVLFSPYKWDTITAICQHGEFLCLVQVQNVQATLMYCILLILALLSVFSLKYLEYMMRDDTAGSLGRCELFSVALVCNRPYVMGQYRAGQYTMFTMIWGDTQCVTILQFLLFDFILILRL